MGEPVRDPLVTLRDLIQLLRRYKLWIALAVLVFAVGGYALGKALPPTYTADGLLVVNTQQLSIPELTAVTSERTAEPWGARSEARVLTSRANIERAVVALGLQDSPEFNERSDESSIANGLAAAWVPDWLQDAAVDLWPALGHTDEVQNQAEGARDDNNLSEIVERVRKQLEVESEERSYAIQLSYRGEDPETAAAIVNAIMNSYVLHEAASKQGATERASERLKSRVDQMWQEWQATNEAIRAMERDEGFVETADGTVTSQALAAIAMERVRLRSDRARAVADRDQIAAALEAGSLNVVNPDLVSPRLQSLWEQEATLRTRLAELGAELGGRHPRMVALRTELADVEEKLLDELNNIRSSLDQQIAALDEQDRELEAVLADANEQASQTAEGRARLNQLEREADLQRALYARYQERYEQTVAALDMHAPDVRIVSPAVAPNDPSSPGPRLLGAVGGAFGLLLSCSFIISRRWLRDRFENLDELSGATGLPGLGAVPQVSSLRHRRGRMSELVVQQPESSIAETMRGILLRIQYLGGGDGSPNVLLVSSPSPTDGKTSLVVAMARIAARDGLKCLAIDCDFRRANLARAVGMTPRHWLNDFLMSSDGIPLDRLPTAERLSGAHYILTRPIRPMSRLVLESPRLRSVIEQARKSYDLVLLDSPPIMNVVDPMMLSSLADAFVLVVSARGSDRQQVLEAIHRAEITGVPVAGLVMSRVGTDAGEAYSYAGYPGTSS